MKLVIFGLSLSSSWGNGHATLWRGLCRALARRGHEIVFFERDVPWYRAHRDLTDWSDGRLVLYGSWGETRGQAVRETSDADAALVTSFCPDGRAACELVRSAAGTVRVFYDLDTPVTIARLDAGQPVEWLPEDGLAGFDLVLSYTGGPALTALSERLGAQFVAPLYGSVDPDVHFTVPPQPQYRADLSYLGTWAADRQRALETLFIEAARREPLRRFLIGGALYPPDFPWTPNIYFVRHLPPQEHSAFYSSSRLTLNITRQAMAGMGWCPSGRLFEAAACGTPLLSDWWDGLDEFYMPCDEILVARNTADTLGALEMTDAQLRQIANRARQRTLDEYTAGSRAREFEGLLAQAVGTGDAGREKQAQYTGPKE